MSRRRDLEGQMSLFDMGLTLGLTADQTYTAGGFPECKSCWCYTCEHSTVGGSHPRPFAEGKRPCPSCEFCIGEGHADICIIGSAKEGCSFRAQKEGLNFS